jgi:hypothetical protein
MHFDDSRDKTHQAGESQRGVMTEGHHSEESSARAGLYSLRYQYKIVWILAAECGPWARSAQ